MEPYFIYCRKSTDQEDRQVLSLESQEGEGLELAKRNSLNPASAILIKEAKSAKYEGRPKFNEMLSRIRSGEAKKVVTWNADRLSRNATDAAVMVKMLEEVSGLEIITPSHVFSNTPMDKFMLTFLCGQAKLENDNKGQNVKRGLKTKADKGVFVGSAKPGYMFDPLAKQGEKDLIPIPGSYELIERVWREILSGKRQPMQVYKLLNSEWGYRTQVRGKLGGKPMHLSEFYRMIKDPFYFGRFEYPRKSGQWHVWHKPAMITEDEFMRVQMILGNKFKPMSHHKVFSYTGLIHCACGSAITAEEKWQTICTVCKNKFSSLNRDGCPKCQTKTEFMNNPTILHYIYYHCTKKLNPDCTESSIRLEELEPQIDECLKKVAINEEFKQWALKYLNELNTEEVQDRSFVLQNQQKNYEDCVKRLDNLVKLKISSSNTDGSLLSDEEFKTQKNVILEEKRKIEQSLGATGQRIENWLENVEQAFDFSISARYRFATGSLEDKRQILSTIGSNLILKDKKLCLDVQSLITFWKRL